MIKFYYPENKDPIKCKGCESCVRICPAGAISIENGIYRVDMKKCASISKDECFVCVTTCPQNILQLKEGEI